MAYNNRRDPGISNIGTRRGNPPISHSFIAGGQLSGPLNQLRVPHGLPPAYQTNRNQLKGPSVQRMNTPPSNHHQQQQMVQQQQQQFQGTILQQQQQSNIENQQQSSSQIEVQQQESKEEMVVEMTEPTPEDNTKKRLFTVKSGKISKKERQRRRNNRLSKILQPKNAVMILNELINTVSYNLTELPQPNPYQFMASVQVGEENHVGYGHSKMDAKSSAAEAALKSIVKNRNFTQLLPKKDGDGDEKMEQNETTLPWQHIASFALYKLLNEWGETPFYSNIGITNSNINVNNNNGINNVNDSNNASDQTDQTNSSSDDSIKTSVPPQNRPAKRMPDDAVHMNPLMLLNQMLPNAQFEELGRSGDPPNIMFTFKCTINDESFIGSGTNKKSAKKAVAFQVCHKILSVQYPSDIYTPNV